MQQRADDQVLPLPRPHRAARRLHSVRVQVDGLAEVGPCSHPAAVKRRPPPRAGALGVELPFWLSSRASKRSGIRSTTSRWYSRAISSKSAAAAPRMLVQPGLLRRSLS